MQSSLSRRGALYYCLGFMSVVIALGAVMLNLPVSHAQDREGISGVVISGNSKISRGSSGNLGSATFPGGGLPAAIPDGGSTCPSPGTSLDIPFNVAGVSGTISDVQVSIDATHSWVGDLTATIIAPTGETHTLFNRVDNGGINGCIGDSSNLGNLYNFSDAATGNWLTEAQNGTSAYVMAAGDYRASDVSGAQTVITDTFSGIADANGTWTLRITDANQLDTGSVTAANLTIGTSAPLLLNEIVTNPPGTDQPCEYIELKGEPGAVLTNIYFLAVDGDGAVAGSVDYVINLSGQTMGSNGILVVTHTDASPCGSRVYPAETTRVQDSTLESSNGMENGSISFLLVQSGSAIVQGTDFDTDNDGNPESFPGDATIVDAIGWSDGGSTDHVYGGVVLVHSNFAPDAGTRFPTDSTPLSTDSWYYGDLADDGNGNATVTYNPTGASANFPADGLLTPGDVNVGTPAAPDAEFDFNGDGITDWGVGRIDTVATGPSQLTWYISESGSGNALGYAWGLTGDHPTPADFDGDGRDDVAIWRQGAADEAGYYIIQSSDSTFRFEPFGIFGDNPRVTGDYDGDGIADPAVFRDVSPAATGGPTQTYFFFRGSNNNPEGNITYVPFGLAGDRPAPGDFDGDGKMDFCVMRDIATTVGPVFQNRFILWRSSDLGIEYIDWGTSDDLYIPGDYDGDGMDDFAVARDNAGTIEWYILERDGGGTGASPLLWGLNIDAPAPGDYDGDGITDLAAWRGADGVFYIRRSSDSSLLAYQWGQSGDVPLAAWRTNIGP